MTINLSINNYQEPLSYKFTFLSWAVIDTKQRMTKLGNLIHLKWSPKIYENIKKYFFKFLGNTRNQFCEQISTLTKYFDQK